jgi:hypothetical protein
MQYMQAFFQHQEQRARAQVQKRKTPTLEVQGRSMQHMLAVYQRQEQRARAQEQERKIANKLASVQTTGIDPDVLSCSTEDVQYRPCGSGADVFEITY